MKKLLLVMLVPVLVLGVMSCVEGVTDTEVDAYIQNAWASAASPTNLPLIGLNDGDVKLIISANQMTVKTSTFTSKPFRITFDYFNADSKTRWVSNKADIEDVLVQVKELSGLLDADGAFVDDQTAKPIIVKFFDESVLKANGLDTLSAAGSTDTYSTALTTLIQEVFPTVAERGIVGKLTAFGWEDGAEIATLTVWYAETTTAGVEYLSVLNVDPATEAWYKYDLPPIGFYNLLAAAAATN